MSFVAVAAQPLPVLFFTSFLSLILCQGFVVFLFLSGFNMCVCVCVLQVFPEVPQHLFYLWKKQIFSDFLKLQANPKVCSGQTQYNGMGLLMWIGNGLGLLMWIGNGLGLLMWIGNGLGLLIWIGNGLGLLIWIGNGLGLLIWIGNGLGLLIWIGNANGLGLLMWIGNGLGLLIWIGNGLGLLDKQWFGASG